MSLLARVTTCLILILLCPPPARGDVRVAIAAPLEAGRQFMVDTSIVYGGIHGSHTKLIDRSFLSAGEEKTITVLAVMPLFYGSTTAIALHPAYYHGEPVRSDKIPYALRTVTLDTLAPVSWRSLLDSGAALRKEGVAIRPGDVNDHFGMILRYYLPGFDRAGIQEDLRQYLPLLHELAAFAHSEEAIQNSKLGMERQTTGDLKQYAEAIERTQGAYRRELDQRLTEIEGWLALAQAKRRRMHDWMENFHKLEYVYREMMDAGDRQRITRHLEQSAQAHALKTAAWTNGTTGVHYTFTLDTATGNKEGDTGYRTDLIVDLNPLLGANDPQWYRARTYPNFIRGKDGVWRML